MNDVHRERNCREVTLVDVRDAVAKARARNPGVVDVPLVWLDLFRRYPEDIPVQFGAELVVGSPLKLMVTRDLRAYVRRVASGFGGPPPKVVRLSEEERRRRDADVALLFGE